MDALQGLIPDHWLVLITAAVTVCGIITTVLPAPKADSSTVYRIVYNVIQWIALNLGKARNAQDVNSIMQKSIPDNGTR